MRGDWKSSRIYAAMIQDLDQTMLHGARAIEETENYIAGDA